MQFLRSRPGALVAVGLVVVVAVVVAAIALTRSPATGVTVTQCIGRNADGECNGQRQPVAGRGVPDERDGARDPALATRTPILVQIENNPIARPPSGLNLADLVIEAPVEGDTTRFGAVFMCRSTIGTPVGPVRSARYFNIDYWQQIHDVTFHFGGGSKVLARFDESGIPYVNGLTTGWSFYARGGHWPAPHNVFFDVDAARHELEAGKLTALIERAGTVRAPFVFGQAPPMPAGRPVTTIGLQTSTIWKFGWEWDAGQGSGCDRCRCSELRRDRRQAPQRDDRDRAGREAGHPGQRARPGRLSAPLPAPRRDRHGRALRWRQGSRRPLVAGGGGDLTTWTYADSGDPVVLPPGKVWWEIVPIGSAIKQD